MPRREVPVDVLKEEAIRQFKQGRTWTEMAHDSGFKYGRILACALGVYEQESTKNGKTYRYYAKTVSSDKALRIAEMLGLDPHDIGL